MSIHSPPFPQRNSIYLPIIHYLPGNRIKWRIKNIANKTKNPPFLIAQQVTIHLISIIEELILPSICFDLQRESDWRKFLFALFVNKGTSIVLLEWKSGCVYHKTYIPPISKPTAAPFYIYPRTRFFLMKLYIRDNCISS